MSFAFKQFDIDDAQCAMKVGTDGVLLGAWADIGEARSVVDVGTGSGLVAIMLAQRFPHALVTGVDIDKAAVLQARSNMARCPWSGRLNALERDFLEWQEEVDAIVCNPPFFVRSLKCPDAGRSMARHDDTLPLGRLAAHASRMLREGGVLAVILPADVPFAPEGLSLRRRCLVRTVPGKAPKRQLLEFVKASVATAAEDEIILTAPDGGRTAQHLALTRDFYIR